MNVAGSVASNHTRGFTLLELLVALSIFAVIGVMTYGGLVTVLDQRAVADEQAQRWRDIQMAVGVMVRDLQQIHPRPVRDEIGDLHQGAVLAGSGGEYSLQLTRGGWTNPARAPRSTQQRVAYRIEGDSLLRVYWPVLDRTVATEPVITTLLEGVEALEWRLLDWVGAWHTQWPPAAADPDDALLLVPRAVEFALQLDDVGRIERLVVSGS